MYSFPDLEPVCCSISSSNCSWPAYRFLRRQVRWCGIPISFRIFHSLLWSTQSKALVYSIKQKLMFFWNALAFLMIQQMLAIWSLVPLPFLKPAWTGSSWFTYCWSLAWQNFEHYFTNVWDECNCVVVWAFFGIAFLWDWNENGPFPVLRPLLSFPNLLAYWVQHFHSIILQDLKQLNWNSITSTSFVPKGKVKPLLLCTYTHVYFWTTYWWTLL